MTESETRDFPATNSADLNEATETSLPPHLNRPRLRREKAAEYLRVVYGIDLKLSTLAKFASTGGGPGFQKDGRWPLYPRQELDAWAIERLGPVRRNTSQGI